MSVFWLLILGRKHLRNARRAHRSVWFLVFTAVAAIGDACVLWLAAIGIGFAVAIGSLSVALATLLFVILFGCPHLIVDWILVPLGWHRAAWMVTMTRFWGQARGRGPAQIQCARALARSGVPTVGVTWLRDRLHQTTGAHDIVTEATLAQAGGDLADARRLFLSLALLRDPAPEAREQASEWLALADAGSSSWPAIVARSRITMRSPRSALRSPTTTKAVSSSGRPGPLWPVTPTTYFLEGVAGRLLGEVEAPSPVGLWLRWLVAPHRRRTLALLRRSMRAPAPTSRPPVPEADPFAARDIAETPLGCAVRCHATAMRSPAAASVLCAAHTWDLVLDNPLWQLEVLGRATALGAPSDAGTLAIAELRDQVVSDLAVLIIDGEISLAGFASAEPSAVLAAAVARARHTLLARLELAVERVGARIEDNVPLPAIDEWRSFLAVHAEYSALASQGGIELERLAFPHLHAELTSWTVWLWNVRREYALSHALTWWLYERALAVGDTEAIELHGKNGAIAVPTA